MPNLVKMFGTSLTSVVALVVTCTCFAAENGRGNYAGRDRGTSTLRMPSIPILPVSVLGNNSVNNTGTDNPTPTPDPHPQPDPHPYPPHPDPDPDIPVPPTPEPECPDGGVQNSSYTVDSCMNDVLSCVNGGALPNGINSLFNEDLRNSIINGMGLCLSQVETCITTVRRNCQNVYETSADVWLDFNARKIQPEYYSFVLRQTGLTPNQAENTCLLLDRNVYGKSFAAVGVNGRPVTSEYADNIGAYNRQENNSLDKNNPMGAKVNTTGYIDGDRGYYARWDAENAQCLIRVAAYNKDTLITNEWLWGAFGNKNPAEVWKSAGSTFTCNKDLFGFPLMRDTRNVALVGIPGGTLVGAGVGALAGHGDQRIDCSKKEHRAELLKELKESNQIGRLNAYLRSDRQVSTGTKEINKATCDDIVALYDIYLRGESALEACKTTETQAYLKVVQETCEEETITIEGDCDGDCIEKIVSENCNTPDDEKKLIEALKMYTGQCMFREINKDIERGRGVLCSKSGTGNRCIGVAEFEQRMDQLETLFSNIDIIKDGQESNRGKSALIGAGIGAATGGIATGITALIENNNINCRVGDGLGQVSFGKSYTIDRLRDFYVKWALNMPDVPAPTSVVTNCENWELTCNIFDVTECEKVKFNYRANNLTSMVLVNNPCKLSGSACIANRGVAQANGVCLVNPDASDTPTVPMVKNCGEWQNECKKITRVTDCNSANVIYTPRGMQVRQACVYDATSHECKINKNKARTYLDISLCPTDPIPVDPNVDPER